MSARAHAPVPDLGVGSASAVLKGASVQSVAHVLLRPGSPARPAETGAGASEPGAASPDAATETSFVPVEMLPGYEPGVRAGFADCEARLRDQQQEMLEIGRRAGFEEGFQQGMERGVAEGREAGRQQIEGEAQVARQAVAGRLARLDQMLGAVSEGIARRLAEAEDDMVALCHEAICRVLGERLSTREGVTACVRRAVEEAGRSGLPGTGRPALALHVHPRDLATIDGDPALREWMQPFTAAGGVRWVPDDSVDLGGCLVRSVEGTLDARLETQLAALRAVLRSKASSAALAGAPEAAPPAGGESA